MFHPGLFRYIQEIRQIVPDNYSQSVSSEAQKGNYIWLEGHLNNLPG
jgi:hypothetical protein